jgi:hypothetical protein
MIMNENETEVQITNFKKPEKTFSEPVTAFSTKWVFEWGCLLATVFLSGAALNCLFAWCAYGKTWDMVGTVFSLLLALISYFSSYSKRRNPSYRVRISVSIVVLICWLLFFPLVMSLSGYK